MNKINSKINNLASKLGVKEVQIVERNENKIRAIGKIDNQNIEFEFGAPFILFGDLKGSRITIPILHHYLTCIFKREGSDKELKLVPWGDSALVFSNKNRANRLMLLDLINDSFIADKILNNVARLYYEIKGNLLIIGAK